MNIKLAIYAMVSWTVESVSKLDPSTMEKSQFYPTKIDSDDIFS